MVWYNVQHIRNYIHAINVLDIDLYSDGNCYNHCTPEFNACLTRVMDSGVRPTRAVNLIPFVKCGNLHALRYFFNTEIPWVTNILLQEAAEDGHLSCVQWLFNTFVESSLTEPWYDYVAIANAAGEGHFECVKWLYSAFTEADACGKLDPWRSHAKYIQPWAMSMAAEGGHIEIMKWLHDECGLEYTQSTIGYAAAGGHLAIVKYLIEDCDIECNEESISIVVNNGHLALLKYLNEIGVQYDAQPLFMNAINHNHFHIARWLHSVHSCTLDHNLVVLQNIGSMSDLLDIKWLLSLRCDKNILRNMLNGAVKCDKYYTAEYLIKLLIEYK